MKKLLSTGMLVMGALSFNASAQLINNLNFSTGWDNAASTTIPFGQVDPEWQVTALTVFSGPTSVPYSSYVQAAWAYASPLPVTPAGTEWVSYDVQSMEVGPYDPVGGSITLQYTFETCSEDDISISATMRSDNLITDIRVDGTSTGFSQTPTSSNWTTGTLFSWGGYMSAGTHTIEVDVQNVGTGAQTNPVGLNVDGFISSPNTTIIDRANFPDYECCMPVKKLMEQKQENDRLQQEVELLKSQLNALQTEKGKNPVTNNKLYQNVPNPTSGSTSIQYYLADKSAKATIEVVDIQGRLVQSFNVTDGNGEVTFDAAGRNQMYIYKFIVDGVLIDAKKMVTQ
jgi:hypothetical protein